MYEVRITPACNSARLGAWLIDTTITLAMMMGLMHYFARTLSVEAFILQTNYGQLALMVALPTFVHVAIMGMHQRSVGMFAMDLQLLQDNGEICEWSNAIRRTLGIPILLLTGFLSALVPLLNEKRRSVGDYLSGARVIESLAVGRRVAYDPWRIFRALIKPLAPISLALAIAVLLLNKGNEPNRAVLLDAAVVAMTGSLLLGIGIAGLKVKLTRVRVAPRGIVRSGWLGWSRRLVPWNEMDYAAVRSRALFPCFEVHKTNKSTFRVPLEHNSAQYTAAALVSNGVRLEQ